MFKEYPQYDAIGLAQLIKSGEISAKQALEAAVFQANKHNPKLNAIIHRFDERAFAAAQSGLPEGIFSGVPYLLKDLNFLFAGETIRMGSRSVNIVPEHDSELVKRMRATGVNTFGKTNTPEFGLIITTEPKSFGPSHNPFKKGYSTGGSSGGSAAAVSAGIVPMAGAGDGGGSIRFPAAWCGVFGFKPSRGRNPSGPLYAEGWEGAVVDHVITRSVRDSAAMLDATAGREVGSAFVVDSESMTGSRFLQATEQPSQPLKIAIMREPLFPGTVVDKEVLAVLDKTCQQLEDMGHELDYAQPQIDLDTLWRDFFTVVCAHTAFFVDDLMQRHGAQQVANLEPQTRNMALIGRSLSVLDLLKAKQGWHDVQYQTGLILEQYDMIVCPTVPTAAVKHGVLPPSRIDELLLSVTDVIERGVNIGKWIYNSSLVEKLSAPVLSKMAFTTLGNVTGLPCMSLPMGMSSKGLPIGMQVIGQMNDEARLFSLAADIERAGFFTEPAI
ncbi:amidase [Psychrobacter sp. FDAARGOS_221]|uniref:amidase n=1 Tax=Psychrobacter sp. FDAARGOS_221 TaxID=1975705 RepID=UPI000BB57AD6|nr:amidase [Psychrobacter sp. FDAARGOS_221]PNK60135.1 amidase [Psychrobacter sp. FDAARGOS_221]